MNNHNNLGRSARITNILNTFNNAHYGFIFTSNYLERLI